MSTVIVTDAYIESWKSIYRGDNLPWGEYSYPTLQGTKAKRIRKTIRGAKILCSEIADLMYSETPEITASPDILDILKRSGWNRNIKQYSEKVLALGGGAFKLYTKDDKICIDLVPADRFIPISWNAEGVYEADFIDRRTYNNLEYLRKELHRKTATGYNLKQEFYQKDIKGNYVKIDPSKVGVEITLEELENGVDIPTTKPLFSYIKLPEANNIEIESPKGISLFANSVDTIEGLDIAFDAFQSEILLGRKRIIIPASAVRKVTDEDGNRVDYFDRADEIFQAFEGDDVDKLKITDNTVELRIEDLRNAIQTYLDIFSIQCGLSAGFLTFDGQRGIKTATEVISENSKTQRTKVNIENSFRTAILEIVDSIRAIEQLYSITVGEFDYRYQDNIHEDRDSKTKYWTERLNQGTITLERFLMEVDHLTEAEAKTKAEEIRGATATVDINDVFVGE
jgi:A118 family predicted phage portal protein